MNLTDQQVQLIRTALIIGRENYCRDMSEHGGDGMKHPDDTTKAAMELMGMQWPGDIMEIFHGDIWTGNEQFKTKP